MDQLCAIVWERTPRSNRRLVVSCSRCLLMVPEETLQHTFDRIWEEIRGANLFAGQARNDASAQSVSRAMHALQLATDSGSDRWMLEAWRMLAYSLTANEQYDEAIPYYKSAIEMLEQIGERRQAARSRIGYVAA